LHIRRNFEDKLNLPESSDPYSVTPLITITSEEDPYSGPEELSAGLVDDFHIVRKTIKKALGTNQTIIDIVLAELRSDPTARMAEVAARLLETLGNSSFQLLQASKTIAEISKLMKETPAIPGQPSQIFNNAVFVGKLEDLFKMQKKKKEIKELKEKAEQPALVENNVDRDK
jgi:hypothetical protein